MNFPSGSNVSVFIDGVHIDLSFRLDWKQSQPKVPIYGYNDYEYTKTAPARKVLQGFLVINFVMPGYLTSVILDIQNRRKPRSKQDLSLLPSDLTSANARATMISSILFPSNGRVSDVDKNLLIESLIGEELREPSIVTTPPEDVITPFDMAVYFTDPEEARWYLQIEGAEITDVSQSYNMAGDQGSAEPLYETYEFIARSRRVIRTT
ncbi:MAG: hypothetical protein D6698_06720 [Gammaproteobacteria bacterium]|nr:MAG: hypothetical protein D6698_06720 [Gammaproteobacteria bacterium]